MHRLPRGRTAAGLATACWRPWLATCGALALAFGSLGAAWQWRDDGFCGQVPEGVWTTITPDLPQPGRFRELGLTVPPAVATAYPGAFEIDP